MAASLKYILIIWSIQKKKKLSQHLKNTYKNVIEILHFDGELDQFLAFLREGKDKIFYFK